MPSKKGRSSVKTPAPVKNKVNMQRFPPKTYQVTLVIPATDDEKYHIDQFVKACVKRDRRAVVAISKGELKKTLPKIKQEELENNLSQLALMVQERLFKLLCENEKIREIAKAKEELKKKHLTNYCPGSLNPKPTSELVERGLEYQYKKYIEDSPLDGPELYIALCEFDNLDIITAMQRLGIHISSIIKVQPEEMIPDTIRPVSAIDPPPEKLKELTKVEEIWSFIRRNRFKIKEVEIIENVFSFYLDRPDFIIEYFNDDIMIAQSKIIYDKLCYLLYDICDFQRQYDNYIDKMKVYIVDENPDLHMESYLDDIEDVPYECDTVPIFLDLILEKVHDRQIEQIEPIEDEMCEEDIYEILSPLQEPSVCHMYVSEELAAIRETIQGKIKALNLKYKICEGNPYEYCESYVYELIDPNILMFDNDIQIKTFSLNRPKLVDVTTHVLKNWLAVVLRDAITKFERCDEKLIKYHTDNIEKYGYDYNISSDSLKQMMHILLFNKMFKDPPYTGCAICGPCPSCKLEPDAKLTDDNNVDPYKCKDIENLIDAAKYCAQINQMNDYNYFEPMSVVELLQYITKTLQELSEMEYEYLGLSDSILLHFKSRKKAIRVKDFEEIIRTPVCMRDFCDFVWDEETDWIDKEENLYNDRNNNQSTYLDTDTDTNNKNIEEDELPCENNDFLIKGSLKYQEVFGNSPRVKDLKPLPKKKDKSAKDSGELKKKSPKKPKPQKTLNTVMVDVTTSVGRKEVEKIYDFIGYNLGNLRVQLNGRETLFQGTHLSVRVELVNWIYKEKILYIEMSMHNHCLYYNNILRPIYEKTPVNFHLILENEIILTFKRNNMSSSLHDQSTPINDTSPVELVSHPLQYQFKATWPNGMLIETVDHLNNFHVVRQTKPTAYKSILKQGSSTENVYTSTSNLDLMFSSMECIKEMISSTDPPVLGIIHYKSEKKRIFLRNGSLIAFNKDNSKLIYCLNGDLYMCSEPDIKEYNDEEEYIGEEEFQPVELVGDYMVITSDGHQYIKTGNSIIEKEKLLFRTARDYSCNEISIRRSDGVNMLLTMDSLITTFPDKTRITTFYYEEPNYIYISDMDMKHCSECFSDEQQEEDSNNLCDFGENDSFEPWISIKLKYIYEHPDYATISYIKHGCSEIAMRPDTIVKVTEKGLFNLYLGSVSLEVQTNNVSLKDHSCQCLSKATLFFPVEPEVKMPHTILKTVDCSEIRKFYVTSDGKCCWNHETENPETCKRNLVCCPREMNHTFIVLNKYLEGGRFLTNKECNDFISIVNEKGFSYSEILNEDRTTERLQLLLPQDINLINVWKTEYQNNDVTPHSLKPKDLSLYHPLNEIWRGPFTEDRPEPLPPVRSFKSLPELLIVRHLCKLPPRYHEIVLPIMKNYQEEYKEKTELAKYELEETIISASEVEKTSMQSINVEDNSQSEMSLQQNLEIKHKLNILTEKSLLALKGKFLDDYLTPTPQEYDRSVHSVEPNPKFLAFMENRAWQYKKEVIYKRALREYLVPPYFKYYPVTVGECELANVIIDVFEPE